MQKTRLQIGKEVLLSGARTCGLYSAFGRSSWRTQRLLILGYHGISLLDEHVWRPGLFLTPDQFASRLESISRMGCPVLPLDDALSRLATRTLPPLSAAITFDDGFYNFFSSAFPILKRFDYRATVYQTTFYAGWNQPIFHLLCHYLLWKASGKIIESYPLTGRNGSFDLRTEEGINGASVEIWNFARVAGFSQEERQRLAKTLADSVGVDYQEICRRRLFNLMNKEELSQMVKNGVDIQLHTHRHRVPLTKDLFLKELADNREFLREIGQPNATHFAYPSGVYRGEVFPWLVEFGIRSATSCETGLVTCRSNYMCLPRFIDTPQISNLEFESWLCGLRDVLPSRPNVSRARSLTAQPQRRSEIVMGTPDSRRTPMPRGAGPTVCPTSTQQDPNADRLSESASLSAHSSTARDKLGSVRCGVSSAPRMKILHVVDNLEVGGTETQMVQMAQRLASHSDCVIVGTLRAGGPLTDQLKEAGIQIIEFPKRRTMLSFQAAYQLIRMARFIRRERIDVVHAHDLWANLMAVPAARLARAPVVISSQRNLATLSWYTPLRKKFIRRVHLLAKYVVVNSIAVKQLMENEFRIPAERLHVLNNGVDFERFSKPSVDRQALFPALDPKSRLIVNVANMNTEIKGHAVLIAAAKEICASSPDVRFAFIGDGPIRGHLERRVRESGLQDRFCFLGRRRDVAEILSCADLFVFPSFAEGLPNSVLEAAAACLPVIATHVGGIPEIIEHGVTGLLVPPGNIGALVAAVLQFLRDPSFAATLARAGQQHVRSKFCFESAVAQLRLLYDCGAASPGKNGGPPDASRFAPTASCTPTGRGHAEDSEAVQAAV
jgi:glycosyltransferase involved in cell wall biosynthesis/peptidoglycan/xylan/chitin deacetylase (PgdA/CDA1 family)